MRKLAVFLVIGVITLVLVRGLLFHFPPRPSERQRSARNSLVSQIKPKPEPPKGNLLSPPPLRAPERPFSTPLTVTGILYWTNMAREENGQLPTLAESTRLDAVSQSKIKDMFDRQYFAHVSPSGVDARQFVEKIGYRYILIGENLALGNFDGDQDLVKAWMGSPGHRANILHARFQEIGVAVGKGTFEGREAWLAVQTFALPLSACPEPDSTMREKIMTLEAQIEEQKIALQVRRNEVERLESKGGPDYEQRINQYNILVEAINNRINEAKALIGQYNSQVDAFNRCVSEQQP